ncbi:MAG: DUF6804 family protein [Microbacterium gubbeenense]|uniref:DUF6804 family protein n=1 Tax=Microbacterium gubbeenense TaxID=159896 RepID=UPI003F97F053
MASRAQRPTQYQRNAPAPGLLAAIALFLAPVLFQTEWSAVVLYVAAIGALIVAWFALQARQWWWTVVFVAVAVLWNPVFPFGFEGGAWTVAQFVAAVAFLVAGALIKTPREG